MAAGKSSLSTTPVSEFNATHCRVFPPIQGPRPDQKFDHIFLARTEAEQFNVKQYPRAMR